MPPFDPQGVADGGGGEDGLIDASLCGTPRYAGNDPVRGGRYFPPPARFRLIDMARELSFLRREACST